MKTATNPTTGEKVFFNEESNKWQPLKTATNPETGEKVYQQGDQWLPYEASNQPEAPRSSDETGVIAAGKRIARRLPGVAEATGQALQNVPENLTIGALGLGLAEAELEAGVSRSDEQAQIKGGAALEQMDAQMADLQASLSTAPRDQRAAIQSKIIDLRSQQGQQRQLFGASKQEAQREARQATQAEIDAEDKRIAISEEQETLVNINAPKGSAEWYIAQAIGATAEMAPALVASVLTRSPAPAMTFMGGYSGGRAYVSGRAEGLTPGEARGYATLNAIAEGIPEAIPVAVLLRPGAKFLTRIVQGAAAESAQEMLTEALQVAIDRGYITPETTWAEARERILDAGIIGSMAGVSMAGVVTATEGTMTAGQAIGRRVMDKFTSAQPVAPQSEAAPVVEGVEAPQQPGTAPPDAPVVPEGQEGPTPDTQAPAAPEGAADPFTRNVLAFVGDKEAPGGFDQVYSGSKLAPPKPITTMSINELLAWQDASVAAGSESSAAGRYQIIRKTLRGLVAKMGLNGSETFNQELQDRLAVELMNEAGLAQFKAGEITASEFGNRLSGVWAALPRVSGDGAGRSTYAGDGLNAATTSVDAFMGILAGDEYVAGEMTGGHGVGGNQSSPAPEAKGGTSQPSQSGVATTPEQGVPEPVTTEIEATQAQPEAEPKTEPQEVAEQAEQPVEEQPAPPKSPEAEAEVINKAIENIETDPTDAQKEAGNYPKGHVKIEGLDVTIENGAGHVRKGTDENGKAWEVTMPAHYGYIKRTVGADGDHVDVYVGEVPNPNSVFVVDQIDLDTGKFDEHKVILSVADAKAAGMLYRAGFSDGKGGDRMGALSEMTMDQFKAWLDKGSQKKPFGKIAKVSRETSATDTKPKSKAPVLDDLVKEEPDAKKRAAVMRKAAGTSENVSWDNLEADQKVNAIALAQASKMPTQKTAPRKKPKKRAEPLPVPRKEIELARKTAMDKLREATAEIKRKMARGDDTLVEVTIFTPMNKGTTFRFQPNEAGLDAVKGVLKKWKTSPAKTLAMEPPSDAALNFDMPMPGHQPLWRSIPTPLRSNANYIRIAGERVDLPDQHKPVRRSSIRTSVERMIGSRVYQGKIKGKTRAGFYRTSNGELRLNSFDDLEVLAHEVAHWLDFHSSRKAAFTAMRKSAPALAKKQMKDLSYTSQSGKVELEGFAEFVRLWLTQYDVAVAKAPDFTKLFEAELAKDKFLLRGFEHLRREMHKYFYQGPLAQARGNIGKDPSLKNATEEFILTRPISRLRQQAVDNLHGIKVAERESTGTIASAENSPYKLMQLVNGAEGVYEATVRWGTPKLEADGSFSFNGKALNEIFRPIYKMGPKAFDDFLLYAAGRRANELKKQDRENLFDQEQIAAMLELKRPEFDAVFDEYQQFNLEMLDFYVDMGLITKDQKKAFRAANENYIPFHRISESLETGRPTSGVSIGARLKGGDRNVRNLADNIVEGVMTNIRAAMIAKAKQTLYRQVSKSDTGGSFAVKIGTDSKAVKARLDDMAGKVAEAMLRLGFGVSKDGMIMGTGQSGTITDVDEIATVLKDNPELLMLWNHNVAPTTQETYVDSAIIGGKQVYFEVQDPVLVDSLLANQHMKYGLLMRSLVGVRRFYTRTITNMVQFITPNISRDTLTAAGLSDSRFRPFWDSLRGMKQILTTSDVYKDWKLQGGGYASFVEASTAEGRHRAQLDMPSRGPLDVLAKGLASYDALSAAFENATRVGEFMRAQERGTSKKEAAFRAREVSTDFSKKPGNREWSGFLQIVPFANAALQGNDRMVKAFTGEDGRVQKGRMASYALRRTFFSAGTAMAAFTAFLWYLQNDDERYKALTPDQKSRFWHIWLPGKENAIQIPKPYGLGLIFADTVENALDYVKDKDGAEVATNLAWAMKHHFWFMDYPGAIQPIVDHMTNQKFTGAPVIPPSLENVSNELQFTDRTPEIYRRMGRTMGVSPLLAEHYFRGYLGYVEQYWTDATETMLWDTETWGPRPFPRGIDDYFVKQFKGAKISYRTKYTEGYYDLRKRAATATADLRMAEKIILRDGTRLQEVASNEMNQVLIGLTKVFAQIDKVLGDGQKTVIAIKYDPSLTRAEKETQIENWYEQRHELVKDVYLAAETEVEKVERGLGK